MTQSIRIRKAKDSELEHIIKLESICFSEEDWRVKEKWNVYEWWVATDYRGYCGFCAALYLSYPGCFLSFAGVHPRSRGQGLQKRMISVRETWARKLQCNWAFTYTAPWNLASSNNLIKSGYTLYEPQEYYGQDDSLYWQKVLT